MVPNTLHRIKYLVIADIILCYFGNHAFNTNKCIDCNCLAIRILLGYVI